MDNQPPPLDQPPLPQYSEPPMKEGMSTGKKVGIGCGCGCLFIIVLAIIALIVIYKSVEGQVHQYTADAPIEITVDEASDEAIAAATLKFDTFRDSVAAGKETEPISLTAEEINILINNHRDFDMIKGHVNVSIEGDKLATDASIPLEDIPVPLVGGMLEGRYLNGQISLNINLVEDEFSVSFDSVEVNGQQVPPEIMAEVNKSFMEGFEQEADLTELKKMIDSITIKDGVLTITPKTPAP